MTFIKNSEQSARDVMMQVNPGLVDQYGTVIRFLSEQPISVSSALRGLNAPVIGSAEYINRQAVSFSAARDPKSPLPPSTIPDEMVSAILSEYFDIPEAHLERIKYEHLLSMGAENMVGDLLERYLASVLEPRGWVWCSGAMVKAADFIKAPTTQGAAWRMLQVKNRDNSENSSSSAIRAGAIIEKWFRTFSRRAGSNWAAFPDESLRAQLSEEAFKDFVKEYLRELKT
jgi:hypothetical protein